MSFFWILTTKSIDEKFISFTAVQNEWLKITPQQSHDSFNILFIIHFPYTCDYYISYNNKIYFCCNKNRSIFEYDLVADLDINISTYKSYCYTLFWKLPFNLCYSYVMLLNHLGDDVHRNPPNYLVCIQMSISIVSIRNKFPLGCFNF